MSSSNHDENHHFSSTESTSGITYWEPAQVLDSEPNHEDGYAVLVLNQPLMNINLLELIWKKGILLSTSLPCYATDWQRLAGYRVAADGGANRLFEASKNTSFAETVKTINLDVVCGDLDSLTPSARQWAESRGATVIKDPDQYSTDFTKSIKYIREHYAPTRPFSPTIVCVGELGGRVDQAMSILHHLYMFQNEPEYLSGRVYLVTSEAITFVLQAGRHKIKVRDPSRQVLDEHVGIIPLREPSHITTSGFEWDVEDWFTAFGGQMSTSNHVKDDVVEVTTTKDVLFTIDLISPTQN